MDFKETAESISLHGLGFLQVKLQGDLRLHVWHPELPRRSCFESSSIHNHRFGFLSRVLVGTQINHRFEVNEEPLYKDRDNLYLLYKHEGDRTKFGNRPWIAQNLVSVEEIKVEKVTPGETYEMYAYNFHLTEPGGNKKVATLMEKNDIFKYGASSLCRNKVEPDINFDRKQMFESDMWDIVRDVLSCQS